MTCRHPNGFLGAVGEPWADRGQDRSLPLGMVSAANFACPRQAPARPFPAISGAWTSGSWPASASPSVPCRRWQRRRPAWQDLAAVAALARDYAERGIADPGGRLVVTVSCRRTRRLRLPACAGPVAEAVEGQRLWGWTQVPGALPGRRRLEPQPADAGAGVRTGRPGTTYGGGRADHRGRGPGGRRRSDLTENARAPLRDVAQVLGRIARVGLAAGRDGGPGTPALRRWWSGAAPPWRSWPPSARSP
jgi:hypothetical protein